MSIQSNFPAIKPTLLLDFANVKALDPRITFTRASTATYIDQFGAMQTAASGAARFDHNPTTLESLGLLIEEQRVNLMLYSEQFDNAAWTKTNSSITANTIVAPNGALTGDKLVEDTSSLAHTLSVAASVVSGTAYTNTLYAKKGERTQVGLSFATSGFGTTTTDFFDLDNGTVLTNASGTAAITSVGNGWYRISATRTATATVSSVFTFRLAVNGTGLYTGDGVSGIFIWGAQLEEAAFSTSYIATVASQVTRSADAASMTGTNFSSWYNPTQGTIYAEGYLDKPATSGAQTRRLADINDGTSNNRILFGRAASATDLRVQYTVSNTNLNGTNGQTVISVFPSAKVAVAYQAANYAFSPNGDAVTTSTAASVPVVNRLSIGGDPSNAAVGSANGTIKKLAYYPLRCTNTQLQALTS